MFFQTREGTLHTGRIAGALYVIGIAPECIHSHDRYCFAGITFIMGWWLCFGAKQSKRTIQEMHHPLEIIGLILIALGLAGQFYFVGPRHSNAIRVGEPNEPVVVQAVEAVDRFHSEVKQQRYQDVCQAAESSAFLGVTSLPCAEYLVYVHQKLGDPVNARRTQLPTIGDHRSDGTVRVGLDYETDYEHGTAQEHFEWRIMGRTILLTSYSVKANALSR
jgi:hypothetical protein